MDDLLGLVDEHTEYFKSHIEALPPQERRVYLALADLWKPATTREIADRSRVDTSKCSAQLTRLIERGVVQVTGGSLRRKQYYLTERLYNIYYLLRRNQGPDSLIQALIRFMESFYSRSALRDIGERMAREARGLDGELRSFHRTALQELVQLPVLAGDREELLALLPEDEPEELGAAKPLLQRAVELQKQDRLEESLVTWDELVQRFGESQSPEAIQLVALALYCRAEALGALGKPEEALAAYEEAGRRFGGGTAEVDVEMLAAALLGKGIALAQLDRMEDSLAVFEEVVRRLGECPLPEVLEPVATALFGKGVALSILNRREEALAAYEEVGRRFRENPDEEHLGLLARALLNKGATLGELGRTQESLAVYEEVVRQFENSEAMDVLETVAKALVNKGATFGELDRPEDELAAYEEVIQLFGESGTPALVEPLAVAFTYKGMTLGQQSRTEEALAALDEVVRRFGADDSPLLRAQVEEALLEKAELELECRRYEAAALTAGRVLDEARTQSLENRWRGHLIRAKASLRSGNPTCCGTEIKALLQILPQFKTLPEDSSYELMHFSIHLGLEPMIELVQGSPSAKLMLPLTTALEQELGRTPRVAQEVAEVARDIRRNLADLRNLFASRG